jgi:hypothetical protein
MWSLSVLDVMKNERGGDFVSALAGQDGVASLHACLR